MDQYNKEPIYNINLVIQETGVKEDTLRAWERRYGLPKPHRSQGGHRLFSEYDIETIKWLQGRLNDGVRIGQAVKLWQQRSLAPDAISARGSFDPDSPGGRTMEDLRDRWVNACLAYDERSAEDILRKAFAIQSANVVCDQILRAGLSRVGEMWYQNQVTVQQEHFTSEMVIRQLHSLIHAAPLPWRGKNIIICNPSGESHTIPNLLFALNLREQGYAVYNLGANVPLENLNETLRRFKVDLVISSAAQVTSLIELREFARTVIEASKHFAFGGRVFVEYPALIEKIPGDYLGDSFEQAQASIEKVLNSEIMIPGVATNSAWQRLSAMLLSEQNVIEKRTIRSLQGIGNGMLTDAGWSMIIARYTNVIASALELDDLSIIQNELAWVGTLIEHRGFLEEMIPKFRSAYLNAVEEALGPSAAALVDRLR